MPYPARPGSGRARETRELPLAKHLVVAACLLFVPLLAVSLTSAIDETVAARGALDFTDLVPVTTRIFARVEEVKCKENQWVNKGDVLFVLDRAALSAEAAKLKEKIHG